jgi:hypothetical protein
VIGVLPGQAADGGDGEDDEGAEGSPRGDGAERVRADQVERLNPGQCPVGTRCWVTVSEIAPPSAEPNPAATALGASSLRVYRISLAGWAWPLVGKPIPDGPERRGAAPPAVPLALLDDPGTGGRLAVALAERAVGADARTVNRELSVLRGAVGWWRDQGWIHADPTAGLRHRQPAAVAAPLRAAQVDELFRMTACLREHAFWRVLYDSADVCPVTGRARMSYRRDAEIFTTLTRSLDPAGRGWTLHQLRTAERPR